MLCLSEEGLKEGAVALGEDMAWVEPLYDLATVDAAGTGFMRLVRKNWREWSASDYDEYDAKLAVITNWRASHAYPLNTFQMNLRQSAKRFDNAPLVARRTKRLWSIANNLNRIPTLRLSQMQDIGGCRAVLHSAADVRNLVNYYEKKSGIKHTRAKTNDYILEPKESGYRGVYLVYRYFSDKAKAMYNGLKIEMQIRSQYQHAWATAVETVGAFVDQALKSSVGDDDWLRFFALMSSEIALRERLPLVPHTPVRRAELVTELSYYAELLDVENRLKAYGDAMRAITNREENAHWFLLELRPRLEELTITGFSFPEREKAELEYAAAERRVAEHPGTDAAWFLWIPCRRLKRPTQTTLPTRECFLRL